MPLDASIIQRGRALDLQKQQQDDALFTNLMKQNADRQIAQQELDVKKQTAGLDVDALIVPALIKKQLGVPLSPEEEARLKVGDALRRSQVAMNPLTGMTYNKNTSLLEGPALGSTPGFVPETTPSYYPQMEPISVPELSSLPAEVANNPKTQQVFSEEVAKKAADRLDKQQDKTRSVTNISGVIDRLEQINAQLKEAGALPSSKQGYLARTGSVIRSGAPRVPGVSVESTLSPDVAALRDEYRALQQTAFPLYAGAMNLPATAMDTEEGRKAILSVFGNPDGNADANAKAYMNARRLFGIKNNSEKQAPQATGDAEYQAKVRRLQELRALKARRMGAQ